MNEDDHTRYGEIMDNCDFYVLILFNIKMPNLGNNTDLAWIDYRLDIFQRYTLRSLLNQSDNYIRIWMICSPESKKILMPKIETMRHKNAVMMSKVNFIFDVDKTCLRMEENKEPIYILKIDSDDLYRRDVVEKARQTLSPLIGISMLMFDDGYIYNLSTKRLSTYMRWSMPTIAVKFDLGLFNANNFRSHCICDLTKVRLRFKPIIISGRFVCCLDHEKNLHADPRRKGEEMNCRTGESVFNHQEMTPAILREFGVEL